MKRNVKEITTEHERGKAWRGGKKREAKGEQMEGGWGLKVGGGRTGRKGEKRSGPGVTVDHR